MKPTNLPRLPIDCFRDDKRETKGKWDVCQPSDPNPDLPPYDPIEAINNAIEECKRVILGYGGSCYPGDKGVMPCSY